MPRKKAVKKQEAYFEMGQWKGLPRWQCKLCRFDTLEGEKAIREHLASVHFPPPVEREVVLPLVDRFGNPIIKTEVVDG